MSDEVETPQQRQARIRQQKREAKIKGSAQERLEKITKLSGRTPESTRNDLPAPTTIGSQSPEPARTDTNSASPLSSMMAQTDDPEQQRLQEEYMRALLSGTPQGQAGPGQQEGTPGEDDAMMKMMQTMLSGMNGGPNASNPGEMSFSADDISKMTGMPTFLTNMFINGQPEAPPTPEQISQDRTYKILRTIMAVVVGVYTIFTVNRSVEMFGQNPPAPATVQNPFIIFVMGELLVTGARTVLPGQPERPSGLKKWTQPVKDVARDGAIVVFLLGWYSWWRSYTG